jgi:MoaA/NifB/PqqE/SkfB family radical SAM enzyme
MKTAIEIARGLVLAKYFSAPFYMHLYVTERCNLQCRMCSIWKRKSKEMTIKEIDQCAKILKELKVPNIVVTGGEPFLRPDIVEIVNLLNDYGFSMRLQTNGTLVTEEKIKALTEAGLHNITISLDTLDKKTFDWICQSKNIVQKVEKSLDIIAENMDGFIVVNTAVSKLNISELPKIVKFVHSKGAYSSLMPVHLKPAENVPGFCYGYSKEMLFSKEDIPEIEKSYTEVLRMKKDGYRIINSEKYLNASLDYFRTGNYAWNCKAGERFFVIYSDGGVAPCDAFPPLFNIKSSSLKKFRSIEYKENTRRIREGCNGCISACWRETNLFIDDFSTKMEQMRLYLRKKTGTHHK